MIIKDSKQCPKCKNYIQRIYGCNQMFCTICHTCFNWVTLEILDKVNVNNPELINYQRLNNLDSLITLSNVSCDRYISPLLPTGPVISVSLTNSISYGPDDFCIVYM